MPLPVYLACKTTYIDFSTFFVKLLFPVADDQSPSKVRTYRSKNFGKNDIEIATALMREIDPNNTLASAKWGQGFREEKDKVRLIFARQSTTVQGDTSG